MTYIQFYTTQDGQQVEAVGGDSISQVDGRLSVTSAILEGARRARSLRGVGRDYTGLRVLRGSSYREARPVTGMIPINDTNTKGI